MPRRQSDTGQPDLFDPMPEDRGGENTSGFDVDHLATHHREVAPENLSDAELLSAFAAAKLATVQPLGEAIKRRRPDGWEAAASTLWARFAGFGVTNPCLEQKVVLDLIAHTRASGLLEALIASSPVSDALGEEIVRAAEACRSSVPSDMALAGLSSARAEIRSAAARIGLLSGVEVGDVMQMLSDPAREVRRQAAIALAEIGEEAARGTLLAEMAIRPSRDGLEALSTIGGEDVVVNLGRIARSHPAWAGCIADLLEELDHPKAARVRALLLRDVRQENSLPEH